MQGAARRAAPAAPPAVRPALASAPARFPFTIPRSPPAARTGAGHPAARRDGYRELAATPLDAAGHPRSCRGAPRRGGLRRDRRRRDPARRRAQLACRSRCRHRRRAAPGQLRELRRPAARQLPADPARPICFPSWTSPRKFEAEMRSLDVPASEVRHPALFGPLGRSRPLAGHEFAFARTLTDSR